MQQDAHEFLNFLINHISEIILGKLFKLNLLEILKENILINNNLIQFKDLCLYLQYEFHLKFVIPKCDK